MERLASASLSGAESNRMDSVRGALQETASRIRLSRSRYNSVNVLLLYWESDHDPRVVSVVKDLADTFSNDYHYHCEIATIPRDATGGSPQLWLHRKLLNDYMTNNNDRESLTIVYYNGASYLDGNRQMMIAR